MRREVITMMNIGKFTNSVVAAVIGVILLVIVAVPIIADNQVASDVANAASINSILQVIPIFIAIGIILGIVGTFLTGRD